MVLYAVAFAMLIISAALGVLLGATKLNLFDTLSKILQGNTTSPEARILIYVRLPRLSASLICGMALAVSGAIIQGVLANRLASPSIIGVNAGAGLAVTLSSAFGIIGGWRLSLFSFLGAFITVLMVSIGAKKWNAHGGTIVLMGVALGAFLGAISDTVATFIPEVSIQSLDFRIGDFSAVTYSRIIPAAMLIIIAFIISFTISNELEVLTLGDESAKSLGLNAGRARVMFLIFAALLASSAVSLAGLVSFVGLLVPHAVRGLAGRSDRNLLPLCALFGAGFVTLCDTVARTAFAPYEMPVGIIMAFLGAPFFVFILIKGKGGHSRDKA